MESHGKDLILFAQQIGLLFTLFDVYIPWNMNSFTLPVLENILAVHIKGIFSQYAQCRFCSYLDFWTFVWFAGSATSRNCRAYKNSGFNRFYFQSCQFHLATWWRSGVRKLFVTSVKTILLVLSGFPSITTTILVIKGIWTRVCKLYLGCMVC